MSVCLSARVMTRASERASDRAARPAGWQRAHCVGAAAEAKIRLGLASIRSVGRSLAREKRRNETGLAGWIARHSELARDIDLPGLAVRTARAM